MYKRWIAGMISFLVIWLVFLEPGCLAGEEISSFLTGEGSWELENIEAKSTVYQEFVPQYAHLKAVSVSFAKNTMGEEHYYINVGIMNEDREILAQKKVNSENLNEMAYTDFPISLTLKPGKTYYLFVEKDDIGEKGLVVNVCGKEYVIPENGNASWGEESLECQLLTSYVYEDAVTSKSKLIVILFGVLAGLGIAIGLPRKPCLNYLTGAMLFLGAPYLLGLRLERMVSDRSLLTPDNLRINIVMMYGLWLLLLLLTQSLRVSITAGTMILTVLYGVDFYMMRFRGSPFKMREMLAWQTAAEVVGQYDFTPDKNMSFVLLIALVIVVYAVQIRAIPWKNFKPWKRKYRLLPCAAFVLGVAAGFYLLDSGEILEKNGITYSSGFDQAFVYQINGYLASTVMDIKASRIQKPEGYSQRRAQEILEEANKAADFQSFADDTTQELPHVILIMNESFSDLRVLGNLELSQENMTFWNSLAENCIKGYVNASVLGGGTADSEFEVFTGCSAAFLPNSYYAYLQCMNERRDTVVSMVEEAGYRTVAMHPEPAKNWNRKSVYELMGFDQCYWKEDFDGGNVVHSGISDEDTYEKIISVYETRRQGEKLFIWDLTMQNHGGYTATNVAGDVEVLNVDCREADNYLSLIKISDQSFEKLISYFADQKEKVIVCMFGDHQPQFTDESFYDTVMGSVQDKSELEKTMSKYQTPFVIWANYDIPEQENVNISMNYLGMLVLKTAGIPCSSYFSFMETQMEEYPVLTVNGYVDSQNNYYAWEEVDPFEDYRILQYDYLFGN